MNRSLTREITEEEIKRALFSLHPGKAPGPDGMSALFFQRYWETIKTDLVYTLKAFFRSGHFDEKLNRTNICLVPKGGRPRSLADFRPISLCNISYKVISKVLSLRLKEFLPELISETQSAFVAGRLITDNILVAQENFHALRSNSACRKKFMAIKTDMSKAFDRVEWNFLQALLESMGFDPRWVGWIMYCISSASYHVLLNGVPRGHIIPTRGIRQGDPISPYLFILCSEALIALIRKAELEGRLTGLRVSRASPPTSHLLFADDSLFFCKAELQQSKELLGIIRSYGAISGQVINLSKSSILFGNEIPLQLRLQIKGALGIYQDGGMGAYLGLPENIQGSKSQVFAFVRDRLQNRINSWSSNFLSKGGKEILIKSQAQAIPTYVMSCFLLPKAVRVKLSSAIARFWWSSKAESRGIHWMAWDKLCTHFSNGGLGFRTLEEFNLALLAKQLWRILRSPNSLLSQVLKGRYFRNSSPLETRRSFRPSFGWRSIMAARNLVASGIRRTIVTGSDTRVWSDLWIPDIPARPPKGLTVEKDSTLLVDSLIDSVTNHWKLDCLKELFPPEEITLIMGINISRYGSQDGYSWSMTKSGNYTVKSGYWAARTLSRPACDFPLQGPSTTVLKAQAWKLKTSRKLKHFVWQCLSGCVASNQRLHYRHVSKEKSCSRCGAEEESINHVIFQCPPAIQVWALSNIPSPPLIFPSQSLFRNMDYLFWRVKESGAAEESLQIFPWIMWYIWKARNQKVFSDLDVSPLDTLSLATQEEDTWRKANSDSDLVEEVPGVFGRNFSDWQNNLVCSIDGSWRAMDKCSGQGWVVSKDDKILLLGLHGVRRSLSPLHSELESLMWAMQCLKSSSMTNIIFLTDCMDLITLTSNPGDWPAFVSELEEFNFLKNAFVFFSLKFIPRKDNIRADCLAKNARSRGFSFTFVSSSIPDWLSCEESLFMF